MSRELYKAFENFRRCAEEAPDRTYVEAKQVNQLIGDTADQLIKDALAIGLKPDVCDKIYEVEVRIYDYLRQSADNGLFAGAEGFGAALNGPAAERVMEGAIRDRDALDSLFPDRLAG
jgi:hypothetical protein